ncbi:MAG: DNA-binding response regulator [Bacteroidetes bacterium]|nr:DNA-binding response regulator [Bacteroidota bacterium]
MVKTVVVYGLFLAGLSYLLALVKFNFLIRELSVEFYVGTVALVFTALGVWMGSRLIRKKSEPAGQFVMNESARDHLGITSREIEVLSLMAAGHSNEEIAGKMFLSLHTVKSHVSHILAKLEVTRRTQAIEKARSLRLIQ